MNILKGIGGETVQEQNLNTDNADVVISLSAEQQNEFSRAIKIGVYKELHKKELLTDTQLKSLLQLQNK